MAKKTLKGQTSSPEPLDDYTITFEYKDRTYSAPIEGNLVMKSMSAEDIKKHLNELPGKLAYWSDLKIQVEMEAEELEADFEAWSNQAYMDIDTEYATMKKTEAWKKARVALDHAAEYRSRKTQIAEIKGVLRKIGVLTSGYNNQVWTLREIARLTTAEMSNIEIRGKGNLGDL